MSDVCLLLEGTYPFVSGGVSSCVHQLINCTPHLTFKCLFIGDKSIGPRTSRYNIPKNVNGVEELYLFDFFPEQKKILQKTIDLHLDLFFQWHESLFIGDVKAFAKYYQQLFSHPEFSMQSIMTNERTWNFVKQFYAKHAEHQGIPFREFYYNWRNGLIPLLNILSSQVSRAGVYHSLSTGYAGLLGVKAKFDHGRPLFLTEHGIYRHEREIEIGQADWIWTQAFTTSVSGQTDFLKKWWVIIFDYLGKLTYHYSDKISTLYDGNRVKQINYGASADKIVIIPNGIRPAPVKILRQENPRPVVSLVGRVVPIKDIKTFIKAIGLLIGEGLDFETWILGPYEEDPDYYLECKNLASFLNIEEKIQFMGMVNLKDYYPKIDLLVLSSISEGQPMVILEGFNYSIPTVSTDVGSCSELIFGQSFDDKKIGAAGDIVPFGRPRDLATAIGHYLKNPQLLVQHGENGKKRLEQFFSEEKMATSYQAIYQQYLNEVIVWPE